MTNRLIFSAFGDEIDQSLDVQMEFLSKRGVAHIELRGIDGENISVYNTDKAKQLKARLDLQGFRTSALGSPVGKVSITDPFEPHLEMFNRMLAVANVLETQYIRIFSFYIPEGEPAEKYRDEVLRRLSDMIELAENQGITLLHENEKGIYGDIPERCDDLFRTLVSPRFKMTYDPSNFVQEGIDNREAVKLLLPHIRYIHVKDSVFPGAKVERDPGFSVVNDSHRPVGQGTSHWDEVLETILRSNFSGFFSIEPHLTNNKEIVGTNAEKFEIALNAAKELVQRVTAKIAG